MLINYLKIAIRNVLKYRFISFINLFGITVGLTCCLLILTYIINELSYDQYNKQSANIYRVTRLFKVAETGVPTLHLGSVAPPAGPLLQNDFKEIKATTTLLKAGQMALNYQEKKFNEQEAYFADEHLFDVFDVTMLKGDGPKALNDPFSVVLSEEMAKKYFGDADPINQMIKVDTRFNVKVTGVYKAFPSNAHMHPSIMVSFNTLKDSAVYGERRLRTDWGNNSFFTYIVLPDNYNANRLQAQLPAFLNRHIENEGRFKPSQWSELKLQKLTDIHLRSHLDYETEENGDIKRVYIFSAIALFILLIACINYMNLSTARSALRAREIGIRKVVGAQRKEIILQFLSESVLLSFVALGLAILLTSATLPWLNKVSGQTLSVKVLFNWRFLLPILLVPVVVGIVSGIYPALFMSRFQPAKVLKGLMKISGGNISFRQVLVTAQFAISIILIISTVVVFKQLRYMQQKSLGFDREHVLTLRYDNQLNDKFESFRNELVTSGLVKNVTRSSRIPTGRLLDAMGARIHDGDKVVPVAADIKYVAADERFTATYGVHLLAGRGLTGNFAADTSAFIINEAAVKALGYKSNDQVIDMAFSYGDRSGHIVGVTNDFHFESMHQKILPIIFIYPRRPQDYERISIKIAGSSMPVALRQIEKTWNQFVPGSPFEYTFMEENFNKLYASEQQQGTLFTTFSGIAIFIACLGLFGLTTFTITQRIKEIGIRKVLGASVGNIVKILSIDFLRLVLIASIVAFPIAWYAMNNWLQDFAYRTSIQWWIFAIAFVMAALIALATISIQAIKAAIANPIKSLRSE